MASLIVRPRALLFPVMATHRLISLCKSSAKEFISTVGGVVEAANVLIALMSACGTAEESTVELQQQNTNCKKR